MIYPSAIIMKFVESVSTIADASRDFELAVRAGMPSISFSAWKPATSNDALSGAGGSYIEGYNEKVTFFFRGTRQTRIGVYLLAKVTISDPSYLARHAHELPFLQPILTAQTSARGVVLIGQTRADERSLAVVSGYRWDVFSYLLATRSGIDGREMRPGEEKKVEIFPRDALLSHVRQSSAKDDLVHVSGWRSGAFLRGCFRQLSAVSSREQFDAIFGRYGVYWRPRRFIKLFLG
jgi:hypothetical protein